MDMVSPPVSHKYIRGHPDVQRRLLAEGAEPMNASPKEFADRIQSDYVKWKQVVEASGAKIE
jgi:tripartite-type tricarboxylate transporter receptor subunit TctC